MKRNKLLMVCKNKLPTICTAVSVASGLAALYFTGKATVKAVRKYDALKESGIELNKKEMFRQIVPYYIPAIGFATTSIACSIASNTIHAKRNRILTLAAASAFETLKEFKSEAKELIGEEKVQEIEKRQTINSERIAANVAGDVIRVLDIDNNVRIDTTREKLHEAENYVNSSLSYSGWAKGRVSLKDFYRHLGIDEKRIKHLACSEKIWDVEHLQMEWETNWVTFDREEGAYDSDGVPLIFLRYCPEPKYEFIIEEELKKWGM